LATLPGESGELESISTIVTAGDALPIVEAVAVRRGRIVYRLN
jgi:hypothetical protein